MSRPMARSLPGAAAMVGLTLGAERRGCQGGRQRAGPVVCQRVPADRGDAARALSTPTTVSRRPGSRHACRSQATASPQAGSRRNRPVAPEQPVRCDAANLGDPAQGPGPRCQRPGFVEANRPAAHPDAVREGGLCEPELLAKLGDPGGEAVALARGGVTARWPDGHAGCPVPSISRMRGPGVRTGAPRTAV
jgi:hypothetical protein